MRYSTFALVACLGLILYAIATNSGAGWLYAISAGIGGVVLVSALAPFANVRGVEVARRAPLVGVAGEPLACEMEVRSTGRLARHLLEVRDRFAGDSGGGIVMRAGRDGPERFGYVLENPRRGVYSGGEVVVESAAPFGLFRGRRRMRVASSAMIHPKTFDVAGLPRPDAPDAASAERNEASALSRGIGGEFWGVREYRPGDPARLIAWRRSARSLPSGRLSVVELARETDPPLGVALNLDPRAPAQAREMVVSAGASLMLRALKEGRGIFADAGPQHPFPEETDADSMLTWCAGLVASRPPETEGMGVEILPSLRDVRAGGSGAGTVVLVSCHAFAGPGPWMTLEEEREFAYKVEAGGAGRRAVLLGPDVREPWVVS